MTMNDDRDQRWIIIYDDEARELMSGWTGGQTDPLYAISSSGGANYAWVFEDAIANLEKDIASVKKLGKDKFQLGKGTFTKKEIEQLHIIRDALEVALASGGEVGESRGVNEAKKTPGYARVVWSGTQVQVFCWSGEGRKPFCEVVGSDGTTQAVRDEKHGIEFAEHVQAHTNVGVRVSDAFTAARKELGYGKFTSFVQRGRGRVAAAGMVNDSKALTAARAQLAAHGMLIKKTDNEYRVYPKGNRDPDVGYFTDDLDDAVATGIRMAGGKVSEQYVADFPSVVEALESAQQQGATYAAHSGGKCCVFFPLSAGAGYEKVEVFKRLGKWHVGARSPRPKGVQLPSFAKPIGDIVFGLRPSGVREARHVEMPWVPPALAREGITPVMLDVVLNGVGDGSKIRPGQSVVIDRDGYAPLREGGYITLRRATPGLSSFGDYYVLTDKGADLLRRWRLESRKIAGRRNEVRDYIAVDPKGRRVGGPFKHYDSAKRSADEAGGHVEFTMGEARKGRAPSEAERGKIYAQDQVAGDHFMGWVRDQIAEAEEMRRRDPSSVFPLRTKADFRKLARNMLQQLEWDTKRELFESQEFYEGFSRELKSDSTINWLADEIELISRPEANEARRRPVRSPVAPVGRSPRSLLPSLRGAIRPLLPAAGRRARRPSAGPVQARRRRR
jgi:hypothetical protein